MAAAIGRVGDMAAADIRAAIEQHDTNRDGVIDYTGEAELLSASMAPVECQKGRDAGSGVW